MALIDTNKFQVLLCAWQTVQQAGLHGSTWRREKHQRTEDPKFVYACLANLDERLDDMKESCESRNALAVFILLGCCLLFICLSQCAAACLQFLAACREVTLCKS